MITRGRRAHSSPGVRRLRPVRLPAAVCPTCRWEPDDQADQVRLREELDTVWWSADPDHAGRIRHSRHCVRCQPHQVYAVACLLCGDGPILTGDLAAAAALPPAVTAELKALGWRPARHGDGWVCLRHIPREET